MRSRPRHVPSRPRVCRGRRRRRTRPNGSLLRNRSRRARGLRRLFSRPVLCSREHQHTHRQSHVTSGGLDGRRASGHLSGLSNHANGTARVRLSGSLLTIGNAPDIHLQASRLAPQGRLEKGGQPDPRPLEPLRHDGHLRVQSGEGPIYAGSGISCPRGSLQHPMRMPEPGGRAPTRNHVAFSAEPSLVPSPRPPCASQGSQRSEIAQCGRESDYSKCGITFWAKSRIECSVSRGSIPPICIQRI